MKPFLKSLLLTWLLMAISPDSMCQEQRVVDKLLKNARNWRDGHVMLKDGRVLSGLLRFDDTSGILSYRAGDISKTLLAQSVSVFSFYDTARSTTRLFFSFEYDDGGTFGKYCFFELLKAFKSFAFVSRHGPVDVQIKSSGIDPYAAAAGKPLPATAYYATEIHQSETIFIIDEKGEIKPFIKILEKEIIDFYGERKRSKNRFLDKKLLAMYTGDHFVHLEEFAEENGLSFKNKSHLLKILDFYSAQTYSQ